MTNPTPSKKQLVRIARMGTLGELIGGIAHHLRNNLAVILGNLQLLAEGDQAFLQGKVDQMVKDALFATKRTSDLAHEMSELSASEADNRSSTDVNEVVRSFADLAHIALGKDVIVNTRLAEGALPVPMNRRDLAACLLFLLSNARYAMPSGGSLVITTNLPEAGDLVVLEVTDTGCGMEPDVLAHATDLFYSSRESGEAGGLGLSVAKDLAEAAGGKLRISSTPEEGTTVSIVLPLINQAA